MKKTLRRLGLIAAAVYGVNKINRYIYAKYSGKLSSGYKEGSYNWRFGKIRYIKAGKGKPLLLVHGLYPGASSFEWDGCIESLAADYEVFALDLLGFGGSDKPALSYSSYLYSRLIKDFINEVIKKPACIAASGGTASLAALSALFPPEDVEKIMLVSPVGPERPSFLGRVLGLPFFGESLYNFMTTGVALGHFSRTFGYHNPLLVKSPFVKILRHAARTGGQNARFPIACLYSGYLNGDMKRALKSSKVPVHIIWGEENGLNPAKNIRGLAGEGVSLSVSPKTALWPHLERPGFFGAACREFFGK